MKKSLRKKRQLSSMDLTPLIDVVFLLLIFFIVTSEFKKNETVLNLALPNSASFEQVYEKKDIIIELSKDELALNAKKTDFEQIKQSLSNLKHDAPLVLKIDKEVKYERIMKMLDILNELDLTNLLLVAKEEK